MRKFLIFVVFVCISASLAAEVRQIEGESFKSRLLNREIAYSVVLPADYYAGSRNYPVVYMLHGVGDNASSWMEYGQVAQILDQLVSTGVIEPFIAVMPQGDTDYYSNFSDGSYPYQDMFTRELVPLIDSAYRTDARAVSRAVIGYSMGGFGALVLPLLNPQTFSTIMALSASIRTDEQYMSAPQEEWDMQWGRIFGARGQKNEARLTQYYKDHSPFHLIARLNDTNLNIFIDNGDKEGTLCRSNEELHMLLNARGIKHTYRVRSGGHDFGFWRSALPDAFRFADCAFRNRQYEAVVPQTEKVKTCKLYEQQIAGCKLFLPQDPSTVRRLYPTVYVTGTVDSKELMQQYMAAQSLGKYAPIVFCFVPEELTDKLASQIIPAIERTAPVRAVRRFRALWINSGKANHALCAALTPDLFCGCMVTNADIDMDEEQIVKLLKGLQNPPLVWIDVPSQSKSYAGSSFLHIALRQSDIKHEFRARDYVTSSLWTTASEALTYIDNKFHH